MLEGSSAEDLRRQGRTPAQGFYPWNEVLDRWNAQTLFLPADAAVLAKLPQAGWVRVWEDFLFQIWVRDTPGNRRAIDRARSIPKPCPWLKAFIESRKLM